MKIIDRDKVVYSFDPAAEPAEYAFSGETLVFRTRDCYNGQIDRDGKDFAELDLSRTNPVTGPLYVRGAEPGDLLKVEIIDIATEPYGMMCVRHGRGLYEVEACHCRRFEISGGEILFDDGIRIPVRPMIGVIGTAPAGPCDTYSPGEHGGNLDIRELGAGSTIYLPVAVPGALLSIGDCHAIQGDGETAICGMECAASVTVRVSVVKGECELPVPFIENGNYIYTTYADVSLDVAYREAARRMHRYLVSTGMSDAHAAMLLSLVGNLRISQVVNPRKGCIMEFPKKYL